MFTERSESIDGLVDGPVGDREAVEAAHRAFYAAWEANDPAALCAVWHESDDICCVYPGNEPAVGREGVCDHVRGALRAAPVLQFFFSDVAVSVRGDVARLTCVENVVTADSFGADAEQGSAFAKLAVTSIFIRSDSGWKLWHHHASPILTHLRLEVE
jgi:uncharacterized protein (TIGR02246 family)